MINWILDAQGKSVGGDSESLTIDNDEIAQVSVTIN